VEIKACPHWCPQTAPLRPATKNGLEWRVSRWGSDFVDRTVINFLVAEGGVRTPDGWSTFRSANLDHRNLGAGEEPNGQHRGA
jgi:hypothetical protein